MMALTQLISIGALTVVALGPGLDSGNREQQAADKLQAPTDSRDHPLAQDGPYAKLFTTPQQQDKPLKFQFPRLSSTDNRDQQPRVVCGMVVVPVTPALDPKMLVAPKNDGKQIDYKIRVIEPRICKE